MLYTVFHLSTKYEAPLSRKGALKVGIWSRRGTQNPGYQDFSKYFISHNTHGYTYVRLRKKKRKEKKNGPAFLLERNPSLSLFSRRIAGRQESSPIFIFFGRIS